MRVGSCTATRHRTALVTWCWGWGGRGGAGGVAAALSAAHQRPLARPDPHQGGWPAPGMQACPTCPRASCLSCCNCPLPSFPPWLLAFAPAFHPTLPRQTPPCRAGTVLGQAPGRAAAPAALGKRVVAGQARSMCRRLSCNGTRAHSSGAGRPLLSPCRRVAALLVGRGCRAVCAMVGRPVRGERERRGAGGDVGWVVALLRVAMVVWGFGERGIE